MGSAPISTIFTIAALCLVALLELAAAAVGDAVGLPRLWLTGITRTLQAIAVCVLAMARTRRLDIVGLSSSRILPGLKHGLGWSAGFAVAAGLLFTGLWLSGRHPLTPIRTPLPDGTGGRILFFVVGGIVAPVAEEIVFRGVIFGYLRRWGLAAAVCISTALFAAIHTGPALPLTQIVGGVVFAIAYHTGKSLSAPILIHSLGNLAIFTLSLPWFYT